MPTPIQRPSSNPAKRRSRTKRNALTIERRRCGGGFTYHSQNGGRIRDPRIVRRLARLAVPPAYVDVAYAEDDSAPLQAMGRDAAGRGSIVTTPIGKRGGSAASPAASRG